MSRLTQRRSQPPIAHLVWREALGLLRVSSAVAQLLSVRRHLHVMAWLNFAQSQELSSVAYALAEEIRAGEWSHVYDPNKPVAAEYIPELVDELRRRCPGYTADAYKRALADGMFGSMW